MRAAGRLVRTALAGFLLTGAIVLTSDALAGSPPDAATPDETQRAQEQYEAGVAHFKARRFGQAAEAFKRSYDIVSSPNSHMMYARSLQSHGDPYRAYEEMALAAAEARALADRLPRYAATAKKTEAERAKLAKKVSILELRVSGPSDEVTVFVGPRQVARSRWSAVAVAAGSVDVVARLPGGRRVWRLIEAKLGETHVVEIDLSTATEDAQPTPAAAPAAPSAASSAPTPQSAPEPTEDTSTVPLRPFAYAAGGLGAAGILTFAIAGTMSRSTFSSLEDDCPNNRCPEGSQSDIDRGKSQQTIANVGLVVGVLGLAGGATLYVLDLRNRERQGTALRLGATPGSVRLEGRF